MDHLGRGDGSRSQTEVVNRHGRPKGTSIEVGHGVTAVRDLDWRSRAIHARHGPPLESQAAMDDLDLEVVKWPEGCCRPQQVIRGRGVVI
ncbi:AP2/ERF domain-containing protein [Psidium guajava]|nr:AP2/ERF domain-containing protein [Psidium guajava]